MSNWYVDPNSEEVSKEEIFAKAANGDFHEWNYSAMDFTEYGYEDVIEKLKQYTAVEYLDFQAKRDECKAKGDTSGAADWQEKMDAMVNEVYDIYRGRNIYPTAYFSELGVLQEIERCVAYKAYWDGDTVSCVSGDTEYFNGNKWKRIDQYTKGEYVLQYNEDKTASLVDPEEYINYESDEPFYEYNGIIKSCLTGSHDIVYKVKGDKSLHKVKQSEILDGSFAGLIPVNCMYHGGNIILSETQVLDFAEKLSKGDVSSVQYICYMLSVKSRRALIKRLYTNIKGEILGMSWPLNSEAAEILATLMSMTGMDYYKIRTRSGKISLCILKHSKFKDSWGEWFDEGVDWYSKYNQPKCGFTEVKDRHKYCFVVPSHMLVLRRKGRVFITGNCGSGVGTTLCKFLFPNLQDTPSKHDLDKKGAESIFAKFHNEQYLKRAIRFCFSYKNGCPVPTAVEGGLRLVGSAPSNFRPMNAKAIYERFCPEGGTIYDFCCVSGSTEYFNGERWKPISEYVDGEEVLQFTSEGNAELVSPIEYIHYTSKAPFYKFSSEKLSSCLTGNHDVVYYDDFTYLKIKQDEILDGFFDKTIPVTFNAPNGDICYSNKRLMLAMLLYFRGKYIDDKYGMVSMFSVDECKKLISYLLDNGVRSCDVHFESEDYDEYIVKFNYSFLSNILIKGEHQRFLLDKDFVNSFFNLTSLSRKALVDAIKRWGFCVTEHNGFDDVENASVFLEYEYLDAFQYVLSGSGICAVKPPTAKPENSCNYLSIYEKGSGASYEAKRGEFSIIEEADKYCFTVPSHMLVLRHEGRIFITGNCGFGGRMLGALSSKNNYKYVGTDPNTETMYHLHQLGKYIEQVTDREDSYELHCCGSEVFTGKPNSIDFAFSSPPYFDLEVYSDEPTQCYNKFPSLEEWLEGYVHQTIKNIAGMLKPGKCYGVNIADFTVGSETVAYVDEWIRLSTLEGMPLFDTVYLGVTARAGSMEQAAGELKKENILIFKKNLF